MRILHIVSNLSVRNGVMSVIMNYFKNIDRDRIRFDFIYFDDSEVNYITEIEKLGGITFKFERPSFNSKFGKQLDEFMKKNNNLYKIIHLHEVFLISYLSIIKKKYNIKIISHAHATKFSDGFIKSIRNRLLSLPNKYITDYYLACSEAAGLYIFGNVFLHKGTILNNAINLKKFKFNENKRMNIRRKLNVENKFVIGHVGNFNNQKNHKFLIKIFKKVVENNKESILVLVGDGKLRNNIIEDIKQLNIQNNVLYLGVKNNINELMMAFDCFVLPSIYEGLGIVLIEAQATGLPCVYSDVVPKEANILESNTILSLKEDDNVWADSIICCKSIERKHANEIVSKAGYNIENEAMKLENIYFKVLDL